MDETIPEMTFDSPIRKIEGKLDINFFANGTDNSVLLLRSCRTLDIHIS